ncbi:hypothetical protein [Halpernia sp.]|uniref:hypothetical protein n=1 Tax=Halpernia sp. TaxID=2782209 RepID=UPI003A8DA499
MKTIFYIVLFLCCNVLNAQKLSDYKYIYVPQDFKEFHDNQFDLNSNLVKKLHSKGYEVIQKDRDNWPEELKQNPCEVALVNVVKSGNMFKTKLTLEAKDCNDKVILSQQGVSNEKDFELGYNESLQNILKNIPNSSPVKQPLQIKIDKVENTYVDKVQKSEEVKKEEIKPKTNEENSKNTSNNYTNGNLKYQKIIIGNGKFILLSPNSSIPFATFTETSKKDIFHVVLENGSMTLGYLENGNYLIEIPNKDGTFSKEVFEKK